MPDYEKINATFSVSGNAETVLGDLQGLPPGQSRSVIIRTDVKYHHSRYHEHYSFPIIERGDVREALRHLDMLWKQNAISGEKHDRLEAAIRMAEIATRAR